MSENVKVAVRVRPFNEREIQRGAKLVVSMSGNTTEIEDPKNPGQPKTFSFDFSYWSHDGYRKREDGYFEPVSSKYADQQKLFDDLGQGVLDNAWEGYNCSLFAYGQTGSGKSHSVVGYGINKGIVPMFCDKLFEGIQEKQNTPGNEVEYQVNFSMLEIYNEMVRDLLNKKGLQQKGTLKVRDHGAKGFVVTGLTQHLVGSFQQIASKIKEGTEHRTVASTNMNATSSRAHTIFAITFSQKTPDKAVKSMTRTSVVNLVDLAGSEKVGQTGAEGDRLKEGAQINKSLSTLGNVIKALADGGTGHVPYRDSVLTRLLKNALGGNSKTIMIAAISPADINVEESISTLRFASRAKAIKNRAVVNEDPTEKLIRELREENERLLKLLKEGGISTEAGAGASKQEIDEEKKALEEELKRNKEEMEQMNNSWKLLENAQKENAAKLEEEKKLEEKKNTTPHFWNLNEDPSLTRMLFHFCDKGKSLIGNKNSSPPAAITLPGLSINSKHAEVTCNGNTISLAPMADTKILVNGNRIDGATELHHNDRVMFGANNLYVFYHPQEAKRFDGMKLDAPTFSSAQEEIAQMSGFIPSSSSKDESIMIDDVIEMMQIVGEANGMSEFMDKKVKFEVALVSPQIYGNKHGLTQVCMRMKDLTNGNEWLWEKNKAENRKFLMQEMYQNCISKDEWKRPKEEDPFWDPPDMEILIGTAHLPLISLPHNMVAEDNSLDINDYRAQKKGSVNVRVTPCDKSYKPVADEDVLENADKLLGKDYYFMVTIQDIEGLPANIKSCFCKYKFYLDKEYVVTQEVSGSNPKLGFEKQHKQGQVTQQFLDYLNKDCLVIEIYGRQKESITKETESTKLLMTREKTFYPGQGMTDEGGERKKKKKKKHHKEDRENSKNGDIIIPVPQVPNKELEEYKTKMQNLQSFLSAKKKQGIKTVDVSDIEALLAGQTPTDKTRENVLGKQTSQACSVQ